MKIRYVFFLLAIMFVGCNHKEEKKELTELELRKIKIDLADDELNNYKEKILLLSTIKGIQYDTLHYILKDYYSIVGYEDDLKTYAKAVDFTAKKHNMTNAKIANLIFCFKYEMLERQEITEMEIEKQQERDAIIQENSKEE